MKILNTLKNNFIPIIGYEGRYSISDIGEIYSHPKTGTGGHNGQILKSRYDHDGYKLVNLRKYGKIKTFKVHRLVAEHFIENPNKFPQVNHLDNNRDNNDHSNLEWCDAKRNSKHCWDQGRGFNPLHKAGYDNPNRKLDKIDYQEIIKLRNEGLKLRVLSEMFGLSISQICYISKRKQI